MAQLYLQRDQPPGVPPLQLTGERTLPDVPEENYWFRRHLVVYEWIASRVGGRRVVDLACGEGYGSAVLARTAASVVGVDANPEAFEHARLKYTGPKLRFERTMLELWEGDVDCVVFLQTIEHVQDPDAVLERLRALIGPDGVAYVSTPNVLTLAPDGRGALGQPVARPGVPRRGVPRAVRAPLRLGRAARPVPRAQAARPPGRDRAAGLGSRAPGAAHHQAVLRPLHAGDLGPRLRPARGRPRPRAGLPRRAAPMSARSPGRLSIVLHTHMPYVEGYGTWPFGEEWLWEAMATSYLPLLDVLDAAPGRITLSLTPVLCDQLEAPGVGERFLAFLREVRAETHRRDVAAAGDPALARELERSAGLYAAAGERFEARGGDLVRRFAPHAAWTSAATHAVLPLLATTAGLRLQLEAGVAAHRAALRRPGAAGSGCPSAPTRRGSTSRSRRRACMPPASTSPTCSATARRPAAPAAHRRGPAARPDRPGDHGPRLAHERLSLARRLPRHAPLHRAPPHAMGGRRRPLRPGACGAQVRADAEHFVSRSPAGSSAAASACARSTPSCSGTAGTRG